MRLARFQKTSVERIKYTIDYTEWLDEGELLSGVTLVCDDPTLTIDGYLLNDDKTQVSYFVSGGTTGLSYTVHSQAQTSAGQLKEDYVLYFVKDIEDVN
jgi:hypothetical protein